MMVDAAVEVSHSVTIGSGGFLREERPLSDCHLPEHLDAIAREIHARGLRRSAKARRAFRDSFPSDEAYREHMRSLALKSARARRERRLAARAEKVQRELARRSAA